MSKRRRGIRVALCFFAGSLVASQACTIEEPVAEQAANPLESEDFECEPSTYDETADSCESCAWKGNIDFDTPCKTGETGVRRAVIICKDTCVSEVCNGPDTKTEYTIRNI